MTALADPRAPRTRGPFSTAAALAVVAVLGVVALAAGSGVAGALTREGITVTLDAPAEKKYSGIAGNWPAAPDVNWTPPGCDNGGGGSASCDRVPVKIAVPEVDGDYVVEIELSWDDPEGVNDLDMYVWDNQQISKRSGGTTFTEMGRSASSGNPEKVKLMVPDLVDYNITILNWAGPNLGYTIRARMKVIAVSSPFESLAPEYRAPGSGEREAVTQPFDYSADVPLSPASPITGPEPPAFGEIAISPDRDFSDFGSSTFADELSAPPAGPSVPASSRRRPPGPVPAVLVVFWFVVVPLVLAGGAAFLLARRARSIGLAYS